MPRENLIPVKCGSCRFRNGGRYCLRNPPERERRVIFDPDFNIEEECYAGERDPELAREPDKPYHVTLHASGTSPVDALFNLYVHGVKLFLEDYDESEQFLFHERVRRFQSEE